MSANPYAPPKAAVDDVAPVGAAAEPVFFPVSRTKLIVMSTLTLTLYQVVWFYHNWRLIRNRGEPLLPIMRTIFAVFFCYTLFDRIRDHRRDLASHRIQAELLALGWIVVTVGSNVVDRLSPQIAASNAALIVVMLVGLASVFFLLPVQDAVNEINRAEVPDHDPNDRFTVWNWLWLVIGGLFLGLVALGMLVPTP